MWSRLLSLLLSSAVITPGLCIPGGGHPKALRNESGTLSSSVISESEVGTSSTTSNTIAEATTVGYIVVTPELVTTTVMPSPDATSSPLDHLTTTTSLSSFATPSPFNDPPAPSPSPISFLSLVNGSWSTSSPSISTPTPSRTLISSLPTALPWNASRTDMASRTGVSGSTSSVEAGSSTAQPIYISPSGTSTSELPSPTMTASSGPLKGGPVFGAYVDASSPAWNFNRTAFPNVTQLNGYNVVFVDYALIISFLGFTNDSQLWPQDMAQDWQLMSNVTRNSIKNAYKSAGINLMVSAFGSTYLPTTWHMDPNYTAGRMADWVIANELDGIDVDYEDMEAMNARNGSAEDWLASFTLTLRAKLPKPYIITHAPVAPWFDTDAFPKAYNTINEAVGPEIDWYNVQFYNQGTYDNCSTLITDSASKATEYSALRQIVNNTGVQLNKLVVGKPATPSDGYIDPAALGACLQNNATNLGWNAGVFTWQLSDANTSWITSVRDNGPTGWAIAS